MRSRLVTLCVLLTMCALEAPASAQQTIFNVPSADVLDRGNFYFELDATYKFNSAAARSRFSSFVPRIVVGMGRGIEVGLNVNGQTHPGPDATSLALAIKWKVHLGCNGWALVVGDHVFVPARNRAYDVGNHVYTQLSKRFAAGTRLTFGGYHFSPNVVAENAQRVGGQFGFEQPIGERFSFQADWYTGKHASGYFTPGFYYQPHPMVTVYFGYSIGNANVKQGNHFFYTAIGLRFN